MSSVELAGQNLGISGEINFATVVHLTEQLTAAWLANPLVKTIDLSKVEHCDSSSLIVLLQLWRLAKKQQRALRFINLPVKTRRLITLSNLEPILLV